MFNFLKRGSIKTADLEVEVKLSSPVSRADAQKEAFNKAERDVLHKLVTEALQEFIYGEDVVTQTKEADAKYGNDIKDAFYRMETKDYSALLSEAEAEFPKAHRMYRRATPDFFGLEVTSDALVKSIVNTLMEE